MKINEATSTDLKVIKELEKLGWKIRHKFKVDNSLSA